MRVRRIVAATDFSESALVALETALSLAQEWLAELYLIHVIEVPTGAQAGFEVADFGTELDEDARRRLRGLVPANYPAELKVEEVVARGGVATEVARVAAELDADMIVVGTHGRSGLSRLLVGSTAETLLRKAPCKVLVAKPSLHPHGLSADPGRVVAP